MTKHIYRLEIETERESGKFASRDEIAEKIEEALDDVESNISLDGLGSDGESTYNVVTFDVEEMDNKELREFNKVNETRAREELPGDAELRNLVKSLRAQLKETNRLLDRKKDEIIALKAERETKKTRVFTKRGLWPDEILEYLPEDEYISFQLTENRDPIQIRIVGWTKDTNVLEIRGGWGGVVLRPQSSNVVHVQEGRDH